jgi:PAS domain S-box-containing protein
VLRELLERLPLTVYVDRGDELGSNLYTSPQLESALGYTAEEWAADPDLFLKLLHPDDRERVLAQQERTRESGAHTKIEYRLIARDGTVRWFLDEATVVRRGSGGGATTLNGFLLDITEQKELEEVLRSQAESQRDTEKRHRRLIEELPFVTYIDEPNEASTNIYTSPQVERLLGVPAEEWVGDEELWETLLHPDDRDRALAEWADFLRSGDSRWSHEYRMVARDGRTVWLRDEGVVVKDDEGTPLYTQGFWVDITDRKEAEERYRQLVEGLPLVTYIDEPDETATGIYISPQVETLLGTPAEEWIGNSEIWPSLLHPDDRERILAEQAEVVAGEKATGSLEYRLIARDGRVVWIRDDIVVVRRDDGEPSYVLGFLIDITERKQAEHALRAGEAELRRQKTYFESLLEISPTAVVTMDLGEVVTSWNPAAERLFGFAESEALGQTIDDLILRTEALHEEGLGTTREALEKGVAHRIARRMRKNGSLVDVEIIMVPLVVDTEQTGYYVIYHDISELQRARKEAEAATQAKSAFLATMSHEIRTPMNAVIGMTGLLLDTELTAEQRGFAEVIRSSGDALLHVIDDILDFSKIEAGKLELEHRPFDLRECVESALDLVAARAAEKGIDVAALLASDVPPALVGDGPRLRQVLANLLSNAVKFTDEGEVVLTVVAEDTMPAERGRDTNAACALHLSVRDTGIGIPEDRLGRLFESFSQVDASTSRRYGGTGLGLAISRRLTELMGGTLSAESTVGEGSTFHLIVTMEEAEGTVRSYPEGRAALLEGRPLLIVDDNATDREILRRQAESWGMLTHATASPAEALAWVRRGDSFEAGVLDMHMPEMDGLALAGEIRRHRDARSLPLVLLTSLGAQQGGPASTEFAAQLTKPVKASQLYEALLRALAETALPREETAARATRPAAVEPLKILLAEDNAVNRQLALLLLSKLGYRADVVENGFEALEALERQPYDVVLMDVQMPELDGLEATRRIRQRWPLGERPRVIAMTANAMQGDREDCLAAGMDDYLAKPIDPDALSAALARSLPLGTARQAAPSAGGPLDPVALERLRASLGDGTDEFLQSLVGTFLEDAPRQLEALRTAVAQGDGPTARRAAHTLKSTAAAFGATALSDLCRELEELARDGDVEAAAPLVARVESEYATVASALEAVREGAAR